ncbi:MAG: glycosyltransferase, partial [Candidatus Lokiarchaeota archaeon]|nr:glycosyltransferase [Candidatus Lokiarchaeota archaeon]
LDINHIPFISIILPLFNEEKTIKKVLKSLPNHPFIEIIVVDDSSEDNSVNKIKEMNLLSNFNLIKHSHNIGYGGAILTGIKKSTGKIIVTMDTDGQHSANDLLNLIKPIIEEDIDLTIGSRYMGKYFYKLPIITRLGELIVEKLIQIFFRIQLENNQNGFKAFKSDIKHIFERMYYIGYAFSVETILRARLKGYTIKECPIKVFDREYGYSKIVVKQLAIRIFMCIFQYILIKYLRLQNWKNISLFHKIFCNFSQFH